MKKLMYLFLGIILSVTIMSCQDDGEDSVVPSSSVQAQTVTDKNKDKINGRVEYSNPVVVAEFISNGFVADTTDVEHFYYEIGGDHELIIHIRADLTYDDKYKILYESNGHVGEELLFNGYLPNPSVSSTVIGALSFGTLE